MTHIKMDTCEALIAEVLALYVMWALLHFSTLVNGDFINVKFV